jgi:integrase
MIAVNPMARVEQIPNAEPQVLDDTSDDIGEGLDPGELKTLVEGFSKSSLYPIVALAAATGVRRGELLALRWSDLNTEKKTLRIERALEQTKKFGIRCKPPKTKRGFRTIDLDDTILQVLLTERERHQRLVAGIPDGSPVDLGLVRLPADGLMFPAVPEAGEEFSLTAWRNPRNFSKEFARRAEVIGFGRIRFHDLRGVHATALLDVLTPLNQVAQRLGDDPAVLLRNYMKRKHSKQADQSLSDALAKLSAGFLGK